MLLVYMVTFTINIPQMLAYIPYMDPIGYRTISIDIDRQVQTYYLIDEYLLAS